LAQFLLPVFFRCPVAANATILHSDYSLGVLRDVMLVRYHNYRLALPVKLVEKP
jgi:hypothetical protein